VKENFSIGGYKWIYADLLKRLENTDISTSAERLGLALNDLGEIAIPLFNTTYMVSRKGVRRFDGQEFADTAGSVLIHYVLKGSPSRPDGQFVTFSELAGPIFKQSSYSIDALERPIIKRFQGRTPELLAIAETVGGHLGGEAGLGAVSLIFYLLPHIPMQLIFYDRDDEFPARATLLFDLNTTQLVEFEVLAVLVTIFVQSLIKFQ